jgi:VWFA-related protein
MHWTKCSRILGRQASLRRAAIALFLIAALSAAQETTLRSRSNLVLVPTLVKDQQGGIVYGLEAKDFVIEDNGIEQTVQLDEAPEGQPVSLVLAIQTGRRANYEFPRLQGLKTMLEPLFAMGTARVAIIEFDSHVQVIGPFSRDESVIDADLTDLKPGDDGASILDAVASAIELLKNEPEGRQRVLLLISETRDHGSKEKINDAVAAIGRINATMYALAFSPSKSNVLDTLRGNNNPDLHPDQTEMHEGLDLLAPLVLAAEAMRKNVPSTVASMTGGEYELFATRKKFEVRMNDFTNHLHSRYLLSFAPKDTTAGLHQIRVRLKDASNATVLARTTYWAEGTK